MQITALEREPLVRVIFASSRIEPPLAEALNQYAVNTNETRSAVIRLALIQFLETQAKK